MPEEIVKLSDDQYYIHAGSGRLDLRSLVLKHADSFAVLDRFGEIESFGQTHLGIFHQDTRFLSHLAVRLNGERLVLLSSAVKEDNALLTVDLTNGDVVRGRDILIPQGTLHILRSLVLWNAVCHARMRIHNYGQSTARLSLNAAFGADFADIFEVRGVERRRQGRRRPTYVEAGMLVFTYDGLDDRLRRTRILFDPPPDSLSDAEARYEIDLAPHAAVTIQWAIVCEASDSKTVVHRSVVSTGSRPRLMNYDTAAEEAIAALRSARAAETELTASNVQFNEWWKRSLADLHMLQTATPYGVYPYAGVPWFSTPFGRDGIITALACLWLLPDMARGVLSYLSATQAEIDDANRDAQPGKVLHETRGGEMAALGEVPFGRYYGSVDATPLFVYLAGEYLERTGDLEFLKPLWPNIERALSWIDEYGDVDGDGFVEYARRSARGLVHQGWKDSHDSVFHSDGSPAEGPVALCEVQGYVFAARRAAARMAARIGNADRARQLEEQAEQLRQRFEAAFWCDDLATYALALDGRKAPCRVRTSNAGHCLFTGIAEPERALRVAETLLDESSFSGWGIRTVASVETAYNPMSYHNGSVWPHDNAMIASGFGRYGFRDQAAVILSGLLDASLFFDFHRLPELFCGFTRRPGETPTRYPMACAPQAWAAATPLPCLQACLGIEVNGASNQIVFRNPSLPPFLDDVWINGLRIGSGIVDLQVTRSRHDVDVRLIRRQGEIDLTVMK